MAGLGTGAGAPVVKAPVVKVYHEKSMILPDVSRVLACLYEKNVEFETVKDSYKDILRLQVTRSVPVPFYDGPIFRQESRAICRYIAETYEQRGYPFLLGKDVLERASIEQWLRHEEHAFDPPSRALFCHLAFPLHDEDMSDIDREKRKLEEVLEVYEQRLGESEFLAGNKFTLADLVHLPNTHHIQQSEFAYLYDSRKNVQRWWNTISARDSWQQVVRDMQSVEEQNQIDELEQQQLEEQWQWETEPPPTFGGRSLRIDPRQQTGTESHTVLVPPPSGGAISSSFFTVQKEQPLPAETTSHGETSPNQNKGSNFFTTTDKTPAPSKNKTSTTQKPPSSVESTTSNFFTPATPPTTTKISQSDFYEASSHTDEAATQTKPIPQVDPWVDSSVPYTKPDDSQTPRSPYTRPSEQRAKDTSGHAAGERPSNQRSVVSTPYAQQPSEQAKKATADQRAAAQLPDHVAAEDIKGETAPQVRYRDAKDRTKEAREADQKRAASAVTRELPAGSQNIPQQSKAPPANLKASEVSPMQEEYEDSQGEDERFSTKRLRKMLEQSDPAALKPQSTDLQTPQIQEETPSIYKNLSYVQDRKGQTGNSSAVGKTDSTPSTGIRDPGTPLTGRRQPDTPTAADDRRATSPPKGGMAPDGRGASATEPRKLPAIHEKQSDPLVPSQSLTSSARRDSASSNGAAQDDDLSQSTIDQWRHTSTPAIQQGAPSDPRIDKLDKTAGVDKREQPYTPNKTSTEQSDKSARQTSPSDTSRTSASTPLQAPASDGKSVPRVLQGSITDARRENEAVTNPRDQPSDQAPQSPSFADRRNVNSGIDEARQTAVVAPDEQPGGRSPKNSVNKPISSNDNGKQSNETYRSSETSGEMAPSISEKSMGQQKMQSDKSSISPQDNGKQGSEAALLINADQNTGRSPGQALQESQKQTSLDTQQVKNNRSNSTSVGSSKPSNQLDGNEGDAPTTQRGS